MATPSNLGENLLNGRDLAAARDAYQQGDAEASKTAHMAGAAQRRQNASSAVPKPVIGASWGAWRLWAARTSQGAAGPQGAPPLSWLLERAACKRRLSHPPPVAIQIAPESHQSGGDRVKTIVFGGLDGILTAHAVIAAAVGAKLLPSHVLALGISNVLADALSMVG